MLPTRTCTHCGLLRYGQCHLACRAPDPADPKSWDQADGELDQPEHRSP